MALNDSKQTADAKNVFTDILKSSLTLIQDYVPFTSHNSEDAVHIVDNLDLFTMLNYNLPSEHQRFSNALDHLHQGQLVKNDSRVPTSNWLIQNYAVEVFLNF